MMNDSITDSFAAGDDRAFEEIFRLHHRRVYALCLRMTRNVAEAEDLTQEVFIQVFRKSGSFRGEASFSTWLHRVTVNQVLMHFRKNRARKEQTTEDGEMPVTSTEGDPKPDRTTILERIILNEVIARLSLGYRTVLVLHDVKGLQHDEIAEKLRCSVGTSKSQLHKARMKLRKLLTRHRPARKFDGVVDPEPIG
jgi:RNA polymerase sigma-70 factor (ECF subfamily)